MLYGLSPHDPVTLIAAFAFLMLVSLAASYLPARSASLTDPLIALREE
jgi:ABC-type lipoprotein release transport system permease subunit